MNTTLPFEMKDVDFKSSIPTAHLTFVIQQLLPVRLIGRYRCINYIEGFNERYDVIQAKQEEDVVILPTGSLSEGLNMPPVVLRETKMDVHLEENTDIDVMIVGLKYPVTFQPTKCSTGKYWALIENEGMHPGYAKVNVSKDSNIPKYQNRDEVLQQQMLLQRIALDDQTTKSDGIGINGPALTTIQTFNKDPIPTKTHVFRRDKSISTDQVVALPCEEWPTIAADWIQRQRDKCWLSKAMIDSLVKDGCHIVAAAHRLSVSPNDEWRISFAATEGRIAREIITDQQRQAYVFIKILYNQVIRPMEIITSYHLKTIFLYACEQLPVSAWEENIGACVFYMLDLTIECVKTKKISSFFIPENNLIDYLSDKEIQEISKTMLGLRSNPIAPVLDFTDHRIVGFACYDITLRNLMEPVLSDIKVYPQHKDIRRTILEAFIPVSSKNMTMQITEGRYEEAVRVAEELYSLLIKNNLTEETFGEFCFWNVAYHMSDASASVGFLEQAIAMHMDDTDFDECKGNLPSLCHAASYRYPRESEKHKEYIAKADSGFKSRFESEVQSAGSCDYVWFLIKQNRLDEAIAWSKKIIEANNKKCDIVYDAPELMILDEVLQAEVLEHNSFSSPSVSLAYYLIIDCLKKKETEVSTIVCDMRKQTEAIPNTCAVRKEKEASPNICDTSKETEASPNRYGIINDTEKSSNNYDLRKESEVSPNSYETRKETKTNHKIYNMEQGTEASPNTNDVRKEREANTQTCDARKRTEEIANINDMLMKFKNHVDEIKLPRTYALYGYCCMLMEDWTSGSEAFSMAVASNKECEYTRAVKVKKYCDDMISKSKEQALF